MRYIDLDQIEAEIPSVWKEKANKKLEDLRTLSSFERKRKLSTLHTFQIWGEVKDKLAEASGQKCWYCETKRNRDSFSVDHFRPKNAVTIFDPSNRTQQIVGAEGYWWLSYEWRNYRFSCNFCNSGCSTDGTRGKNDLFPLVDERVRIKDEPSCFEDHRSETPLLLDPTNENDIKLIVFDRDGSAKPRFESDLEAEQNGHVVGHTRAHVSIYVYGLNGKTITRCKKEVLNEIRLIIATLDTNMGTNANDLEKGCFIVAQATLELAQKINPNAEYYSVAKSFVDLHCITRKWLKDIMNIIGAYHGNV